MMFRGGITICPTITELRLLSEQERAALHRLEDICRHSEPMELSCPDSDVLSAHPAMPLFFLAWHDGELIGALTLFDPEPHQAEAILLVHPSYRRLGLSRMLWNTARRAIAPFHLKQVLFCLDLNCPSGLAVCSRFPTTLEHSEFTLVFDPNTQLPPARTGLTLCSANVDHIPLLTALSAAAFGDPPEESAHILSTFLEDSRSVVYAACLKDVPVGQIVLRQQADTLYFCAFCIAPTQQGQGLGRDTLLLSLKEARKTWGGPIRLDVDLSNTNALSLYTSLGFRQESRCDYYVYPL